jgi:hypothetical protein
MFWYLAPTNAFHDQQQPLHMPCILHHPQSRFENCPFSVISSCFRENESWKHRPSCPRNNFLKEKGATKVTLGKGDCSQGALGLLVSHSLSICDSFTQGVTNVGSVTPLPVGGSAWWLPFSPGKVSLPTVPGAKGSHLVLPQMGVHNLLELWCNNLTLYPVYNKFMWPMARPILPHCKQIYSPYSQRLFPIGCKTMEC